MNNQRIIYPAPDGGIAIVIPTGELPIEEVAAKDAPAGVPYKIIDASDIPSDRTFRAAWAYSPDGIEIDLDRAKAIGHDLRRANRNAEFAPHDKAISLQIPGAQRDAAEAARAAIRARYVIIESAIDAATTTDEIKEALSA